MNTFVDAFLEVARRYPDKPAVMDYLGADTYSRLNHKSAYLAEKILNYLSSSGYDVRRLRKEGKNGVRIALLLPRTREYLTALLAVVRAGCAIIPMDAEYPRERVQTVLEDAGAVFCLTSEGLLDKAEGKASLLLEKVMEGEEKAEADTSLNLSDADIEGLLIFTSGSTGKPKGVIHRQYIFNCGYDLLQDFHPFTEEDTLCCMAGFPFIAAVQDLIPALMAGGNVYIADEIERKNVDKLYGIIQKRHITGMYLPPQMYAVMRSLYGRLPLKYVLMAGEKSREDFSEDGNLIEVYGTSETACVLIHWKGKEDVRMLGKAGGGARVYLLNEEGAIIENAGEIGELGIVSPWLAMGYNNLPEETADRFVECPFEPGQIMYKTGDFMAYDEDANLLFHGRKDRMVKIRGYRVELGEIENVLIRKDEIKEAACVAVSVGSADKLCCYYTGEEHTPEELRNYVSDYLTEYMVPDYFVWMEELPRNERNKVNYLALKAMEPPVEETNYRAPETPLEERVCKAFAEVLGLQRVSVLSDFFDLGGTSLSVSILISELSDLKSGLSFQDVSNHPTPRALAAYLQEDVEQENGIPPMDRDFYPLTKTQMGIYLEGMTGGNAETYSCPYLMRADPSLTAEQLIAAVQTVVSAHPSMKYIIRVGADSMPHMFMEPMAKVTVPVIDGTEEDRLEFMKRFIPVVPVTDELLFHFAVYRTPERCYLAIKSHLIFFDGTSISLLIAELNRALKGMPLTKEECTIQQVGMLEEQMMRDGTYETARKYHEDLFHAMEDIPPLAGDLEGPLTPGVSENMRFEPGTLTTGQVRAFCERNQITESSFFMGAMALMLGKYLNSSHVSFSTVYNGRARSEMSDTFGTLIKRIPVYGDLSANLTVGDFLRGMSRQTLATMSHDIFSFDEVLKNCPVNEDIEFIYQGDLFTDQMGTAAGETLLEGDAWFMEHYHTGMVTGCMSIQFFATNGLYNMTLEYRNEKFSAEWVRRFAENLFIIAEGLLKEEHIGDIRMLNKKDLACLARFNDTAIDFGFVPVHEQIRRWADKTPDRLAVAASGKHLTFGELNQLSDQVAVRLQKRGIGRDVLVGVLMDREVYAYVSEIGILKAGGAFVPFIPDYPDERIDFCMEDGKIGLLLTSERIKQERNFQDRPYEIVTVEQLLQEEAGKPEKVETAASDLAYCIYTSGTTGRPKGVMIEHGNIANYVNRNEKSLEIMHYAEPGRVCLALASFSFDVSVVECFVPLCNGNRVVLASEEEIHTPGLLAKLIESEGVDGITCTPTYLLNLLDIEETREAIRGLTFFDIGAEAFPARLYNRLRELREDSVILNVYGPTEATMGCAAELMNGNADVTVGPPIANTTFYVSDTFGNELPVGIRGELIICGDQVGRGYINMPDKTRKAFFQHNGQRAYHSGDLASWTPEGTIRIFGRVDNQIKLRGFRIELDEIEKVITEFPGVKTGTVAVQKNNGAEYLVGYYTSQTSISPEKLKQYIQEKLPEYMVPAVLLALDKMPMTSSGKVDRKALPLPDFSALRAEYIAPETEEERALCHAFAIALGLPEDQVGLQDDFFELGGDSLKAMVALTEAHLEGLGAADIFQKRTPNAILEVLHERIGEGSLEEREMEARKVPHSLTPLQIQMIDTQLFRPHSTMWSNMHFLVRFDLQKIDPERFCRAVNQAIQNHPALSTAFRFNDDYELEQQYIPGLLPEVKIKTIQEKTAEMLPAVLVLPFQQILNACLCRVGLYRSPSHLYLFMDVHHILMDGGSLGVLLADIVNAYFGKELKKDYYFAILAEEEKRIAAGNREKDREWFAEHYGDMDWCNIPPAEKASDGINQASREKRLGFRAEQVAAAENHWGVTHSVMAIAAALITLSRFTGKPHVITNWIFNNRLSPEAEASVGMLIKNLPVALRMEDYANVRELLASVKEQVAEGIAHSTYDFMSEHYQAYLDDCMEVNLQLGINGDEMDVLEPTLITLEDEFTAAGARLELELLENEYGDGAFDSEMEYAEGLFDKEKMIVFHDMYVNTLERLVDCEDVLQDRKV